MFVVMSRFFLGGRGRPSLWPKDGDIGKNGALIRRAGAPEAAVAGERL